VLAFEVAPNVHVGWHALFAHHDHGDSAHETDVNDEDAPDHGDRSVEHRGLAIIEAPPPIVWPPPTYVVQHSDRVAARHIVYSRKPQTLRGRGPPSVS